MQSGGRVTEKKVHQLGTWACPHVDNHTIDRIKAEIQKEKGTKVKMALSADGLRVMKTSMIQGKMLMEFIPMIRLQFFTIAKNSPDVLFVVSVLGNPTHDNKFQITVFRFTNGMDASIFVSEFKRIISLRQSVTLVRKPVPTTTQTITTTNVVAPPQEESINWTLRSKEHDNSKRELRNFVDMGPSENHVHHTTEKTVVSNGHTEVFENGARINLYRKGKPSRMERESFESDFSDNRSEVSEGALRVELESLSQELRDIKIMLEKSTGLTAGSEPNSPRDFEHKSRVIEHTEQREFEPVDVTVHRHTMKQEPIVIRHSETTTHHDNVDAVVVENEQHTAPVMMNGYTSVANGDVTHVRVSVPDYRGSVRDNSHNTSTVIRSTRTESSQEPHYEIVERRKKNPNTTSYENWKRNTMERNAIRTVHDFPERIQWKSRSSNNRASHVVTSRPRSALPSWSSDHVDSANMVEVRHHPAGMAPGYQRVSFNPRVVKVQDRKTQSLRMRGISSTVVKPIDRVYVGRQDAKHHSMSLRPQSATLRPSILIKDAPPIATVDVEQNNNVIKLDNDDTLLDVSGIDLYRETPIEGTVIRT